MAPERLLALALALSAFPGTPRAGDLPDPSPPPGAAPGAGLSAPPPPPAAAPEGAVRADLDLVLNGEAKGPVQVLLEAGDVWMDPADLEGAGLALPAGRRTGLAGSRRISLHSLAPGLAFQVDERSLELRLTAGPDLLGRRTLDLRASPRPELVASRGDASAFLDYALEGSWPGGPSASFEVGTSGAGWLALGGATRQETGTWTRGLTSLMRDETGPLRRWIAGDAVASGGPLGGGLVLGGLSVQREFSLDPYLLHAPLPSGTAVATSPSTLEVYVNGTLVRRERLSPGTYDLANLPVTSGAGVVQAVLRDAYGRTQELDSRYYYSSGLLAEGLSDYGYHLGFARRAGGGLDLGYGDPVLLARHRLGLSGTITAGLRAEASPGLVSGGPSLTAALPWGEVEAVAAGSGGAGRGGAAGQLSWSFQQHRFSAGVRLAATGPRYATTSLLPGQDRALLSADALVGSGLTRSLSLEGGLRLERRRDAGEAASFTARASLGLGAGAVLVVAATLGRLPGGSSGTDLLALLSWSLGGRTSGDVSAQRTAAGAAQGGVGLQRPLPRDEGVGYRVAGSGGGAAPSSAAALGQAQTGFGRYELELSQAGPLRAARASAAGALVLIDGRFFASRPVESSFALVRVPGLAGVRGLLENQEVGRTDRDGDLLVPSLLPYQANRLSIRGEDVPLEYELGRLEQLVAPPFRGGAVARFAVQRISAVTGTLGIAGPGERLRPENGEVVVEEGAVRAASPVAAGGRFWLDGLPAGRHRAEVTWRGGTCNAVLDLAPGPAAVLDLGEVACQPAAPELRAQR